MIVEQSAEVARIIRAVEREGKMDLEAVENALRKAVMVAGAEILEAMLEKTGKGLRETPIICSCGERMESQGLGSKTVLSLLGEMTFSRSMYQCPSCHRTRIPGDEALDIVGTSRSPGVRRLMAHFGSKETFKEVSEDLCLAAGLSVSPKDCERVAEKVGEAIESWTEPERKLAEEGMVSWHNPEVPNTLYIEFDGTGIPVVPEETQGRRGKQADGSAKTREAKLGCVFSQTSLDKDGKPIRDPNSTTFVGAIEKSDDFGWRIYGEASRRGLLQAHKVVVLTDGAEYNMTLTNTHFPMAVHILDMYHAKEHVTSLCRSLFPQAEHEQRLEIMFSLLEEGKVEALLAQAEPHLPLLPENNKDAVREYSYLEKNKERMRYAHFRAQGFFVGSGVIEAACKNLIGRRLKQSGMEWSVRGANAIIALRCNVLSNRFEDFWADRASA